MKDRYAKDPSFFRAVYVDHMDAGKYDGPTPNKSVKTRGRYAMEFDDMIQQVKAYAWDEGYEAAYRMAKGYGHVDHWMDAPDNPYRHQEEA